MTAIWHNDGKSWKLLTATDFPAENTLQSLVESSPQILPLAGSPRLVIVGREILLGANFADLVGIESTGRLAIIEVKLKKNAEARRAVIAQILTYAAYLKGITFDTLEQFILKNSLQKKKCNSLVELLRTEIQDVEIIPELFEESLRNSLLQGHFRLVIVLDEAPEELIRLVGYLSVVTNEELLIDLITVSNYKIGNEIVCIPQRIDPEKYPTSAVNKPKTTSGGRVVDGGEDFRKSIHLAPLEAQPLLRNLYDWAQEMEKQQIAYLKTYYSKRTERNEMTLLPYIPGYSKGMVTIYLDNKGAYLQFWRSVFVKHAPSTISRIEELISPSVLGQGNIIREVKQDLLDVLTLAYREASQQSLG